MAGKPINDSGNYCPLWRSKTVKVCHTCELYVQVIGENPQTGERMDRWECAYVQNVVMQIEVGRQVRTGAHETNRLFKYISRATGNRSYQQIEEAVDGRKAIGS
jgi:hypothetical protein